MKNRISLFLAAAALAYVCSIGCSSCNKKQQVAITISPEAGTRYKAGVPVSVKISYPADAKPDSIVYLVDSVRVASKKDSSALILKTDSMRLGPRLITVRLYKGGKN